MGRRVALVAVLVAVTAILVHARSAWGGFVYDDHRFIVKNPAIRTLSDPGRFFTDPSTASAAQGVEPDIWRPLRTLDYAIDYAVLGAAPAGWHVSNVLLHAAVSVLVWLLLWRLLARDAPTAAGPLRPSGSAPPTRLPPELLAAAAGALAFAVHPATVEVVAWVSSRGDLLAWLFVLAALEVTHAAGAWRTAIAVLLVAMACLAKESAIVAFALLPLRDAALPAAARVPKKTTWTRTALLAATTVAYLAARAFVMPQPADLPFLAQVDFPDGGRAAAVRGMLAGVTWYARVLLWPTGFPFDRNVHTDPVPLSWGAPEVVLGAGILLSVFLAGVFAWRRGSRVVAFGWLGALVAFVPVSQVVVPLKAFAAERFLYPALPCLAALAAAGLVAVASRLSPSAWKGPAGIAWRLVPVAILVALSVLCVERQAPWHDDASLWTAVQHEEPMNPRAYEGLGFQWLSKGHLSKAERAFTAYREFQPEDGKVHAELAAVFRRLHEDLTGPASTPSSEVLEVTEAPRFVLAQAIAESRAAVGAWARVGLARGRGDRKLLRSTLAGWRAAALDYGDLLEAQRANDLLASDDRSEGGVESYEQRRMRPLIAATVLLAPSGKTDPSKDLARRRMRAQVLAGAGLEPSLSDFDAWGGLVPQLTKLLEERPQDFAVRRNRASGLLSRTTRKGHEGEAAELALLEQDLEALVAAYPKDRGLREALDAVRRK